MNGSRSAESWLPSRWCCSIVSGCNWWQLTRKNGNKQDIHVLLYHLIIMPFPLSCMSTLNPRPTCRWLQELYLLAGSYTHGVSRTPGGRPRTNTDCCPQLDCSWSVHSGACVLVRSQHSAGPSVQYLQLSMSWFCLRLPKLSKCSGTLGTDMIQGAQETVVFIW